MAVRTVLTMFRGAVARRALVLSCLAGSTIATGCVVPEASPQPASNRQSVVESEAGSLTSAEPSTHPSETVSESNARRKAADYLDVMAFSRSGLIKQLEFEGFSTEDATYGADAVGADWDEQAAKKAADYLDVMAFSRSGLIKQLEFEGFTRAEAEHGVNSTGL